LLLLKMLAIHSFNINLVAIHEVVIAISRRHLVSNGEWKWISLATFKTMVITRGPCMARFGPS